MVHTYITISDKLKDVECRLSGLRRITTTDSTLMIVLKFSYLKFEDGSRIILRTPEPLLMVEFCQWHGLLPWTLVKSRATLMITVARVAQIFTIFTIFHIFFTFFRFFKCWIFFISWNFFCCFDFCGNDGKLNTRRNLFFNLKNCAKNLWHLFSLMVWLVATQCKTQTLQVWWVRWEVIASWVLEPSFSTNFRDQKFAPKCLNKTDVQY